MGTSKRWAGTVGVMVVVLVVTSCSGGGNAEPTNSSADRSSADATTPEAGTAQVATTAPVLDEARTLLAAANLADPATLDAIDAVRFTDEAAAAAAAAIASDPQGDELWAAVWVYGSSGTDPTVLAPVLSETDSSIRALAAASSLAMGDEAGGAALVELLGVPDDLRGADPPVSVQAFAATSLARFVAGPEIAPDAAPDGIRDAWNGWWAEHGSTISFDPATRTWTAS